MKNKNFKQNLKRLKYLQWIVITLLFFSCNPNQSSEKESKKIESKVEEQHIFIGTYSKKEGHVDGKGKGIHYINFEPTKNVVHTNEATIAINPSFVAISKDKKYLYAVNELNPNDGDSGTVSAFKIDHSDKKLSLIGKVKEFGKV